MLTLDRIARRWCAVMKSEVVPEVATSDAPVLTRVREAQKVTPDLMVASKITEPAAHSQRGQAIVLIRGRVLVTHGACLRVADMRRSAYRSGVD